nr:DNA-processing protein DprA [Micromonospora sp. DSM 115978]
MMELATLVASLRRPGVSGPATTREVRSAARDIAGWRAGGIGVHAFFDDRYPAQLRGVRGMPPLLFSRGDLRPHDRGIAVIGSRRASEQGLRIARTVATSLVGRGVTVVSGLAAGIDTAAHTAALGAGGRTVAVIGTGVNRCYPPANRRLQQRIADAGLVLSQFRPDAGPTRQGFPTRNALMSGYAAATVIVEAGETSGARIQARHALQQGRPLLLTDLVMHRDWVKAYPEKPGVHVVAGLAELLDAVDEIMASQPTESPPAGEIERAEDAADFAAARDALARIEAGEKPVPLAAFRAELGLPAG